MEGGGWKIDDDGYGAAVDLSGFVVGSGQADRESFDFAEPAFSFGFVDPGDEIVADVDGALSLCGPVHRASQAGFSDCQELAGCHCALPVIAGSLACAALSLPRGLEFSLELAEQAGVQVELLGFET